MRGLVMAGTVFLAGVLCLSTAAFAEEPLAKVGDKVFTRADIEQRIKPKLIEIEAQKYEAMREGLDEAVAEELFKLEATSRKITPEQLEKDEIAAKVPAPADADIQKVYDENKEELQGQTLDQVKPQIIEYLKGAKEQDRRAAFIEELKKKYKTTDSLKAPVIEVATAGRPERGGGAKAPVTIVEFSDYQCPFCKRGEESVQKVFETYGDKVRIVFRDYPLPFHPQARPAAEAANCANEQGKFWDYNKKLFANQDKLSDDNFKAWAKDLGMDDAKFAECYGKKTHAAQIDKDIADGVAAGVNGTPAFFINGRSLSGAQPFDKFKEVIDEELAHAKPAA